MENNRKEIVICLGSSCFARGNKQFVKVVTEYLKEHNLLNEVKFHGERCFGQCASGPSLKLDGMVVDNLDDEKIIACLEEFLAASS